MKKIIIVIVSFLIAMATFGRYSLYIEKFGHEKILVRNLTILSGCMNGYYICDDKLQNIIIQESKNAVAEYSQLEKDLDDSNIASILQAIWATIYLFYSDKESSHSSDDFRGYYEKIGCDLSKISCDSKE